MARAGPRKVSRYGDQFMATAVKLSTVGCACSPFVISVRKRTLRDLDVGKADINSRLAEYVKHT
jgi:hypothetical protein